MAKILIVEDSTFFRRLLKETLLSQYPRLDISEAPNAGFRYLFMRNAHNHTGPNPYDYLLAALGKYSLDWILDIHTMP